MQFALRPHHPLASRRKISWPDLLAQRWVVWTRDVPSRDMLETALVAGGCSLPRGTVESNKLPARSQWLRTATWSSRSRSAPSNCPSVQRFFGGCSCGLKRTVQSPRSGAGTLAVPLPSMDCSPPFAQSREPR
ncbi:LysR substrate-binding domain-containing protein [Variovorax paradoxus]|uniref:LysR substrate-binding domain-containing protein n=1 Tax=Variovorax paradoxus TaxID=34073 RepID=UPI003522A3FE